MKKNCYSCHYREIHSHKIITSSAIEIHCMHVGLSGTVLHPQNDCGLWLEGTTLEIQDINDFEAIRIMRKKW